MEGSFVISMTLSPERDFERFACGACRPELTREEQGDCVFLSDGYVCLCPFHYIKILEEQYNPNKWAAEDDLKRIEHLKNGRSPITGDHILTTFDPEESLAPRDEEYWRNKNE
jgi:hypothetical protein